MEVIIRKPFDYEEEAFIHLCCELSSFNREHHPEQKDDLEGVIEASSERASRLFQDNDEKQIILMAVLNEEPVGYALGRVFTPSFTSDNGIELTGVLEEMYIMKKARGIGIGKKLLKEVEEWVKENGADRLRVNIYEWNKVAIAMHTKKGFDTYEIALEKKL